MSLQKFILGTPPTYDDKVLGYSPLAFFTMNEESGNITSLVGGYTATVGGGSWLYKQAGIGDGGNSMWGGSNLSHLITADAPLEAAFDPDLGTYMAWVNYQTSGAWDTNTQWFFHADTQSTSAVIRLRRNSSTSVVHSVYGEGSQESVSYDASNATGWHVWALTWNQALGDLRLYFDGIERDFVDTGLDDMDTERLWIVGNGEGSSYPPNALVSKVCLWTSELSADDLLDLASL
ncbi:hypothetical protein KAR91_40260 [Candidatus Pacearchaeota archaeon]|nr:hypothetical protein [Candidatus Pacearchaeota archaeon]